MGQAPTFTVPDEILELKSLLEAEWPARRAALHASGVPLNEDDPDPDPVPAPVVDPPTPKPWGDDANFDPDRAWNLIEATRADREKLRIERDQLAREKQEREDAAKSEEQKREERTTLAEQQAAAATRDAARLRVALKKGLTETQAKRLVGDTEEELEADADELLASFVPPEEEDGQEPPRRPRERLRPGAVPSSEPEETDPRKLAALVRRT